MAEDELTQEEQDEADRKARKKSFKITLDVVTVLTDNSDGLARVAGITDEEWQAAVDEDSEVA